MQLQSRHALLPLTARRPQRLHAARGLTLRAARGTLWITVDRDTRDIVLREGEQWVVDRDEPVLALPLNGEATLEICEGAARRQVRARSDWSDVLNALWDRDGRWAANLMSLPVNLQPAWRSLS